MKKLTILDLDNTLIYGTTIKRNLSAKILFHFSKYLTIYERPHAREFVKRCHTIGDVVVFTTAEREYATKICEHLEINPVELFTREDCLFLNGSYVKSVPEYYFDAYDSITIIDDIPEIWDKKSHQKCRIIGVKAFTGEVVDDELRKLEIRV
ncbi:HAD family hydrolase [Mariniphaga sp.]|uniref:HAD family hydrolase n=1 Tax=Mariniphaga sp. TaxID=1954475 RepID=UPI0035659A41